MLRTLRRPTRLLLAVAGASIIAIIVAATPTTAAQNVTPPTAVQAARTPHYASRLAHPAKRPLPPKPSAALRAKARRGPLDPNDIYDNGPPNGNTDAWTINFGFVVSDTLTISSDQSSITGMTFAAWLFPGDTVSSVEISITSGENGGTSYFDQVVGFTQGSCTGNQFGFNVCTETASFTGPMLNAGTYWVNLQNASVPSGDPVYWDENSGPALASENSVGSIPSEAFTILGEGTTTTSTSTTYYEVFTCPEPAPGFHDLRDFSPNAGASGLAVDTSGKLYGTFAGGGNNGAGLIYDFAQRAGHWFLSSLYSFLGGSDGNDPNGVIIGLGGKLFGGAQGGVQTCGYNGSTYCGLIYQSDPPPHACATALCSWNETPIYQFTGNTDAWGGTISAFDAAGNVYGIGNGGAYGFGAVFELSPSQSGWTEKILHNFTGGNDGGYPTSLLLGRDGNLYGTTQAGGNNDCGEFPGPCGLIFQLIPSASGWTENVIYLFTGSYSDGWDPKGLIQDSQGNLYGVSVCFSDYDGYSCSDYPNYFQSGVIFRLTPSASRWVFSEIHTTNDGEECPTYGGWSVHGGVTYGSLTFDPTGNLWATEGGAYVGECGPNCYVLIGCGSILNVSSGRPVITGFTGVFDNITSDANGNLYGTTNYCGFGTLQRNTGMIWQYSP